MTADIQRHSLDDEMAPARARELWLRFEVVHEVAYFSPHVTEAAAALGWRGFWMGYFAMRSAPLGQVDPALVTATFYGFHPDRVMRALPDAWKYATAEQALATRSAGVAAALAELGVNPIQMDELSDLLWQAAQSAELQRRGWLDTAGVLTDLGRAEHEAVERATDEAAVQPWAALGWPEAERVRVLLEPAAQAVIQSGLIPQPNPAGLVWNPM